MYPYIRFNLEGGRIIYLQLIRVLPRFTRIVGLLVGGEVGGKGTCRPLHIRYSLAANNNSSKHSNNNNHNTPLAGFRHPKWR